MEYIKYTRDSMKEELRRQRSISSKFKTEKQYQSWCNQKLTKIKKELKIQPLKRVRLEGRNESEKPMDVYAPEDYNIMLANLIIEYDKATRQETETQDNLKLSDNLMIDDTEETKNVDEEVLISVNNIFDRLKNKLINQDNEIKQLVEQHKKDEQKIKEQYEIINKFIELGGELV